MYKVETEILFDFRLDIWEVISSNAELFDM